MSPIGPGGAPEFPLDEILGVLSQRPETDEDDLPPDVILKRWMDRRDDGDEGDDGGAGVPAPLPHHPSAPDAAIALPLPVDDDAE